MVKKDKVVVFIKGTPAEPMCGFSNAVVQILRMHGVDDYAAYNVLEDQGLRQGRHAEILPSCAGSNRWRSRLHLNLPQLRRKVPSAMMKTTLVAFKAVVFFYHLCAV